MNARSRAYSEKGESSFGIDYRSNVKKGIRQPHASLFEHFWPPRVPVAKRWDALVESVRSTLRVVFHSIRSQPPLLNHPCPLLFRSLDQLATFVGDLIQVCITKSCEIISEQREKRLAEVWVHS